MSAAVWSFLGAEPGTIHDQDMTQYIPALQWVLTIF